MVSLVLVALVAQAAPASAQGGFFGWFGNGQQRQQPRQEAPRQDSWFGRDNGWFGQRPQQQQPQQPSAYNDPYGQPEQPGYGGQSSGGTGRTVSYCVRLCDGRYFPMHRQNNATSIQLCNAFCPAAKTQVFTGSAIEHAYTGNGARYSSLENAFVYREKVVPNCTCNGRDSFGLAKIDVAQDPTLKQGDVVATGDNVKAALLAMHAAKERAAARETAINDRTALRGTSTPPRRGNAPAASAAPPQADAPAEIEDRPED